VEPTNDVFGLVNAGAIEFPATLAVGYFTSSIEDPI
jgi:hypothetical protein